MPRDYLRKAPDRCIVTDEQLEAAKLLISKGASKRKAASQVGLKESTLRKRLKAGKTATSMGRFSLTFTQEQENDIYNYIKQSDDLYYGLTMQNLQKLVYEYAEVNKITHRFNTSSKLAGRDWVYGFLKRFPELKLRQPVPTSIARAMGFNKIQVTRFYDNLQSLYNKYKFVPSRIYNMDESGVNTVPKKIPKVISVKGKKLVGKIVSAERGQTITIVCAMSATGNYVPPAFIFPRKRMKGYLLNNAPEGSIGMVSDSGFINTALFLEYLHHFKDNVQPTKDNPVLLILDNHSSHISLNAILFCRDNGIHMLTLPPHSSHKMQPLDRGFFGPLKTKFAYACDKWLSHHPGRVIGQTEIAQLVNEAFQKAASLSNAVSGFKVSGIWPIDRDIFSEEDFAAASVTDMIPAQNLEEVLPTTAALSQPFQEDSIPSHDEYLTNLVASISSTQPTQEVLETAGTTSPSILHNLSISEQDSSLQNFTVTTSFSQPAQDLLVTTEHTLTSSNADEQNFLEIDQSCPVTNTSSATTASSPTPVPSTSKEFIPLSSIQALPKATSQNRRRKGKMSIIATDSPYKSELEAKKEEQEEKLAKKKIIGEREYAVRPTRRPSEELQTGQPLEVIVQQFDEFVRSLQVDPHSPLFRLVTDGQPPLRQCLHPEACSKDLSLPTYYARFHDIRKEYVRAYTLRAVAGARTVPPPPPPPDHPGSLLDMLNYLGISPYSGDNFYAAEVKDMASIIQRIITDGFRLELPETVDLVLETGICSKDDEIDGNCIVRARGLPWQSSDQDIAKFFRGLNVAKGGVALCLSPQGRRNGEALVRFVSQEHRDMALKRHKHHIGSRYIEVYRASGEDFLSVAGGATCEAAAFLSRGAQVIVRMRGLPYDATPQQVLDFFSTGDNPVLVLDGAEGVLFVRRADGRATGDAFVLFAKEDDAPKALSRHRKSIGARYIELFRSTTAEVQQVLNRSLETRTSQSSTPSTAPAPAEGLLPVALVPQHVITSGTAKDCVRLRGLPYEAQVEHILTFLDEFAKNIVVQGVHMVYNAQGHPSGEAFIQMDSEASAFLCAQQKHHRYMTFGKKQRYIEVFQCSGDDMNLVLTGGVTPATSPKVLSPGPMTYYYPAMGPTLPPPPLVYWGYPTPPVSPAHYYHPPHHPQTMIPEVVSVGGGSPIPIPPTAACPEWPIFMVN